jgi:carbonic anhydrase
MAHNEAYSSLKLRKSGNDTSAETKSESTPSAEAKSGSTPSADAKSGSTPSEDAPAAKSEYNVDLKGDTKSIESWFDIKSYAFLTKKYPVIKTPDDKHLHLKFGNEQQRLNEKYEQAAKAEGAKSPGDFWFKIKESLIYYTATKTDMNILGSIMVKRAENATTVDIPQDNGNPSEKRYCLNVYDFSGDKYIMCTLDEKIKNKWMCSLQIFLEQADGELICFPDKDKKVGDINLEPEVTIKNITQPLIIIPLASKKCNENWNYKSSGDDWECQCKEGFEQSPIDLPTKDKAIPSTLLPVFQYEYVNHELPDNQGMIDDSLFPGANVKIKYERNSISINHPNMGKIVTLDGAVYKAQDIIFHTPSEHTIGGEQMDMEMQIVHHGVTKGDIAKTVILSFLFKSKPGIYNRFIDTLDFFNLPNPKEAAIDLDKNFFIPNVLVSSDEDEIPMMKPFSFYTYSGSWTQPPCIERTTHYVASDPIDLSSSVIALFKEALKGPDYMNDKGQMIVSEDGEVSSNRNVQPLNNRNVYLYDHIKNNCPEFKTKRHHIVKKGHYEKRQIDTTQYVYVTGDKPTGIPNSFVVSADEAKGIETAIPGEDNKEKMNSFQ